MTVNDGGKKCKQLLCSGIIVYDGATDYKDLAIKHQCMENMTGDPGPRSPRDWSCLYERLHQQIWPSKMRDPSENCTALPFY